MSGEGPIIPGETPDGTAVDLEGEVQPDPIPLVPTPVLPMEVIQADGRQRVMNTGGQNGIGASVIVVVVWIILVIAKNVFHVTIDLDPLNDASTALPLTESLAMGALAGTSVAYLTNRNKIKNGVG